MPNIAQQDYIIIDWEGKDSSDATKKAEVDAQLKNIFLANPLALLSVIFKNYAVEGLYAIVQAGFYVAGNDVTFVICADESLASENYLFSTE